MTSRRHFINVSSRSVIAVVLSGSGLTSHVQPASVSLLNVSYDLTRELDMDYYAEFIKY